MSTYDLVIKGGTIVDGTRLPRFRSDLGIRDGRVAKIGRIDPSSADRVLDATRITSPTRSGRRGAKGSDSAARRVLSAQR